MIDELPERCACGARLVWAIATPSGALVPLDSEGVEGGGHRTVTMIDHLGRLRPVVQRHPDGRCRSHFTRGACPLDRPPNQPPRPNRRRRRSADPGPPPGTDAVA